jgi:hypothetical protein
MLRSFVYSSSRHWLPILITCSVSFTFRCSVACQVSCQVSCAFVSPSPPTQHNTTQHNTTQHITTRTLLFIYDVITSRRHLHWLNLTPLVPWHRLPHNNKSLRSPPPPSVYHNDKRTASASQRDRPLPSLTRILSLFEISAYYH